MNPPEYPPAGLLRRLAALFYDALLLLAVLMAATALVLPLTGGEAIRNNPFYTTYLFLVSFFFFAWSWIHGGQTLGMRAWRLRVQRPDGRPITWGQALLRFLTAIASLLLAGAGWWWMLIDRRKRTWHDIYSESVVVKLPK